MNEREQVRGALVLSDDLHEKLHEIERMVGRLSADLNDAVRRAQDAERRAEIDQRQADDMTEKAGLATQLMTAAGELVEALDRLPLRMEDAGMKQTIVPPDIPLYGTHDWEAVEQAKRRLFALLPERKENNDGGREENPAGAG